MRNTIYKVIYTLYLKSFLKHVIPFRFIAKINRALIDSKKNSFSNKSNKEIFDLIYQEKHWGDKNTNSLSSGSGTENSNSNFYSDFVNKFILSMGIKSVLDIGCGDFTIGKKITKANPQIKYIGVDVSETVINYNTKNNLNNNVSFLNIDATMDELPLADLCCIRQVLQHLNNHDIQIILKKVKQFKYVLITEHLPKKNYLISINKDKSTGPDIRLYDGSGVFINEPPFNMNSKEVLSYSEDLDFIKANITTFLIEN